MVTLQRKAIKICERTIDMTFLFSSFFSDFCPISRNLCLLLAADTTPSNILFWTIFFHAYAFQLSLTTEYRCAQQTNTMVSDIQSSLFKVAIHPHFHRHGFLYGVQKKKRLLANWKNHRFVCNLSIQSTIDTFASHKPLPSFAHPPIHPILIH